MPKLTIARLPPLAVCTECGDSRSIEPCAACGTPVCPSHRAGLGSLSDGYTCKDCHGYGFGGFASAAATPLPSRARQLIRATPGWLWFILGVLITLAIMLILALGHPPP